MIPADSTTTAIETTPKRNTELVLRESLTVINELKFFLSTAPVNWKPNQVIRRYYLNSEQGFVSCIFWNNLFYITGTDIVKACLYKMEKFGREITQKKKFEEGIFSDLRNLKCGIDAILEQPKSDFLSFLFKNMCLKTQKKQKVFFWFSVPHDRLFADALERDLKRESLKQQFSTKAVHEPALSFHYEFSSKKPLYVQIALVLNSQESSELPAKHQPDTNFVRRIEDKDNDEQEEEKITEEHIQINNNEMILHPSTFSNLNDKNNEQTDKKQNNNDKTNLHYTSRHPSVFESPVMTGNTETSQKLVVDQTQDDDDEANQNKIVYTKQQENVDKADEDDFPLDYFPISIEYPNQPQQQQQQEYNTTDFHPQFPSVATSTLYFPQLPQQIMPEFHEIVQSSSNATISEEDSIPKNLNRLQHAPQASHSNLSIQSSMTNREFYESANKKGEKVSHFHMQSASSSSFNPTNSASIKKSDNTNEINEEDDVDEGDDDADIQYEYLPTKYGSQVMGVPPQQQPPGPIVNGGVQPPNQRSGQPHPSQMYPGYFYPMPYNSAPQEYVMPSYDSQTYFPDDYMPYGEQHESGSGIFDSVPDFQQQQQQQQQQHQIPPSAYPFANMGTVMANQTWSALPPEALQPAIVVPTTGPQQQFTTTLQRVGVPPGVNSYMPPNWGGNGSPFGSRVNSATTKKFPINVFSSLVSSSSSSIGQQQGTYPMGGQGPSSSVHIPIYRKPAYPSSRPSSTTTKLFSINNNSNNKVFEPLHNKHIAYTNKVRSNIENTHINVENQNNYSNEDNRDISNIKKPDNL